MKLFFCALILLGSGSVFSADKKETESSDFRCEKMRVKSLSELKLKMIENCDLNKPFSSSLSVFAGEDTYLYCCHAKP